MQSSVDALAHDAGHDCSSSERYSFHAHSTTRSGRSAPLGAIAVIESSDVSKFERCSQLRAVQPLLADIHRPRVSAVLGRRAAVLESCAFLARPVPVYGWRRSTIRSSDGEHSASSEAEL